LGDKLGVSAASLDREATANAFMRQIAIPDRRNLGGRQPA
jgi:hypothetical protein